MNGSLLAMTQDLKSELRRLADGPSSGENPGGVGTVRFLVRCPLGTNDVLAKAKEVLRIVDEATLAGWPVKGDLTPSLPEWFASACVAEMSSDQAKRWLAWWKSLPPEEQTKAEIEKDCSLNNWLYWMEPNNRQWFWWDAKAPWRMTPAVNCERERLFAAGVATTSGQLRTID
jgi:hypothetical protein